MNISKTVTAIVLLSSVFLSMPLCKAAHADEVLPQAVLAEVHKPLVAMGNGTYHKFGFSVYKITFWTTDGTWDRNKPYALEMRYVRDVSKGPLVDTVTDDFRDEQVADDVTIERWHQILVNILPDVQDGDTIV